MKTLTELNQDKTLTELHEEAMNELFQKMIGRLFHLKGPESILVLITNVDFSEKRKGGVRVEFLEGEKIKTVHLEDWHHVTKIFLTKSEFEKQKEILDALAKHKKLRKPQHIRLPRIGKKTRFT